MTGNEGRIGQKSQASQTFRSADGSRSGSKCCEERSRRTSRQTQGAAADTVGPFRIREDRYQRGLNALLADFCALYLKTKTFHWHLSRPDFRDYHSFLDEQADQIFAMTDPIARACSKAWRLDAQIDRAQAGCNAVATTTRITSSRSICSLNWPKTIRR